MINVNTTVRDYVRSLNDYVYLLFNAVVNGRARVCMHAYVCVCVCVCVFLTGRVV